MSRNWGRTIFRGGAIALAAYGQAGLAQSTETAPPPVAGEDEIIVYGRAISTTTLDIPQTVNVLSENLIAETASDRVGDALRFVPGASRDGSDLDAFGDQYMVRGFGVSQTVNGVAVAGLNHARDTANIDRIEVLKGPASVLYGQMQPGAVVNIVTKQPTADFQAGFGVSAGRYNNYRGEADLSGPLNADGSIAARITGAYENTDSFVDFWNKEHVFVAPVIAFKPGPATKITLEGLWSQDRWSAFYNGLPAEGTVLPNPNGPIARNRHIADPSLDGTLRRSTDLTTRIEHDFTPDISNRLVLSWTTGRQKYEEIFGVLGWEEDPDASEADNRRTLTRALLVTSSHANVYGIHNDLNINFALGGMEHQLSIGADYEYSVFKSSDLAGLVPSIDLYNPVYSTTEKPEIFFTVYDNHSRQTFDSWGIFVQDRIKLSDAFQVVGGLRYAEISQELRFTETGFPTDVTRQSDTAWTTTLGLLFNPTPSISLFASRATSFLPVSGTVFGGKPLDPERGTQYEAGVKANLAGGMATATVAAFHITRANVAVDDRDNPGFLLSIGEQRAKGVEASINARPAPGLTLYAGYAYTDNAVTKDTEGRTGNPLRNVPKNTFSFHGNYEVQQGPIAGFSVGGSLTYVGKRAGDIGNNFTLPGYTRVDGRIGYSINDHLELYANVDNLTNEDYFSHALGFFEVFRAPRRTWKIGVTGKF